MRFSIIIPVYNTEFYLGACLESIDSNSFRDFELIVVDDGSTDSSGIIADEYAASRPNVKVLHGQNQGPLLARRRGLNSAQGQYVIFLDSDDALRSDSLQVIDKSIEKTGADIVSFLYTREPGYSMASGKNDMLPVGVYSGGKYQLVKEHVCGGRFNSLWGKAIRLNRFDRGASYEEHKGLMHGEDWLQLMPIVDASTSLVQLGDILYFYRPSDSSSTARFKDSQLRDITRVNRRLREYARQWGGECPSIARRGEVLQYLYLLKISELSDVPTSEKANNFESIRLAMNKEGVFGRAKSTKLRSDNRLLVDALEHGNRGLARIVIKAVEAVKR